MDVRFPRYAPALLLLVCLATAACGDSATSPSSLTPVASVQSALTVEPRTVEPEFVGAGSCAARPPFGFRLRLHFDGRHGRILQRLRFHLIHPGGRTTLPEVIPIPEGGEAAIPSLQPIPTPGITSQPGTTIPIPGSSPLTGIPVGGTASRPLPFFLKFACGAIPAGTVIVTADLGDAGGRLETSQARVPVSTR